MRLVGCEGPFERKWYGHHWAGGRGRDIEGKVDGEGSTAVRNEREPCTLVSGTKSGVFVFEMIFSTDWESI